MKAIRVLKRGKRRMHTVHWLTDDEETVCRLAVDDLQVVEDLDLEKLPPVEGCGSCARIAGGWKPERSRTRAESLVVLSPSLGRMRKTGPLHHGTRITRGAELR